MPYIGEFGATSSEFVEIDKSPVRSPLVAEKRLLSTRIGATRESSPLYALGRGGSSFISFVVLVTFYDVFYRCFVFFSRMICAV